ncbi:uncharacterized protein N7511_008110 [Penicillium nucicola]|uniref:uncharacterized protein n=1 Tax=Penicillium nucicola TaxID=1850975 RepID=UPI002545648C|nr:uncharacterized protein N7511_008110 [Penicillium nucicola]KAJ5753957.1 hypothetical protein N7511_008110 [Penicillium nucicola]
MTIERKLNATAQLSLAQRSAIVSAHKKGATQVQLAEEFGCTRKTIYNTLKRYSDGEKLENREKAGRPPILSERTCNYIYLQARRHPNWTLEELSASIAEHPSISTVRRILRRFEPAKRVNRKSA